MSWRKIHQTLCMSPVRWPIGSVARRRHAHTTVVRGKQMPWRGDPSRGSQNRGAAVADSLERVRNIGIIAHIDAGKTTVTERMLFYSGAISSMGEVHDGSTTMDFMDQERKRGITISSAAISFNWRQHRVNLVDTPGHVDFTMEVERSLRVLDGSVVVLDGSAGVEAQTLTVWRQACRYAVPAIAFINKMDKRNADLSMTLHSMEQQLGVTVLMAQLPLGECAEFSGVVDLVTMQRMQWSAGGDGTDFSSSLLTEQDDGAVWQRAAAARATLLERAADLDDELATEFLQADYPAAVSDETLQLALRRITAARSGLVTLCGSALRNTAMQPLLDAVLQLLPSPRDRQHPGVGAYRTADACALAFKTVHDRQRGGALTYLRVYSGCLTAGQRVYNVNRGATERLVSLMTPYADRLLDESRAEAGSIVVASGLEVTATGDTLSAGGSTQRSQLLGVQVPPPVFFCSIEAPSQSQSRQLETALQCLQREDPSLQVHVHPDTGQTLLSGMGELHLSVVRDRIRKEYRVEADIGEPQIAYMETPCSGGDLQHELTRRIADSLQSVTVHLHVRLTPDEPTPGPLALLRTEETVEHLEALRPRHLTAARRGVQSALQHGPLLAAPLLHVQVLLQQLAVTSRTADHVVTAATARCLSRLLQQVGCRLLEPVMRLQVTAASRCMGDVMADLSQRRVDVLSVEERRSERVLLCDAPLSELRNYSTALRTLSSGSGTYSMELHSYRPMSQHQQQTAIQHSTGVLQ